MELNFRAIFSYSWAWGEAETLGTATTNGPTVPTLGDEEMNIEHWWNDN
jgi:hypothetical protein